MSDIELVIKIPEEYYKNDNLIHFFGCYSEKLDEVIKNGTPLPKGHGRLIDADATLKRHCTELCAEKPSCHEDCLIYDLFHLAPTIIESNKESEE